MRRLHDVSKYEALELVVAQALVQSIRDELEAVGLTGRKLQSAVSSIASSVACLYDGATFVEAEGGDHLVPIVGFVVGRMRNRLLVPEEGSSVHEFISGVIEQSFG
jgi:hypothetical protein